MEWLTNLLGFANQGTSPFGALGGGTSGGGGPTGNIGYGTGVGATGPIPATPPAGGAPQLPGLLGKLMGQQSGQPGSTGLAGGGSNQLLSQALNMLKGQQIQPPPMMNLLSGPRA